MQPSAATQRFLRNLDDAVDDLGLKAPRERAAEPIGRRRSRRARPSETRTEMVFVEHLTRDGASVLTVEESRPARRIAGRRRRAARARGLGGTTVQKVPFERLPPDKIGQVLEDLDRRLTLGKKEVRERENREFGLHRIHADGTFEPIQRPEAKGPILLLIHGTFSSGRSVYENIAGPKGPGAAWLAQARKRYAQILSLEHPTLGVSPVINARELAISFGNVAQPVDVICHSRGGIVARWWVEGLQPRANRRVVFVASPLGGTGLAAAPNIRSTLSLLANVSRALGTAAAAVPFVNVVAGVFQVVSSVTSLLAKTPAVDAAVALVPGLHAQSRVGNNQEFLTMRRGAVAPGERYFAIQSNFEPESPKWAFWKYFRDLKLRAADLAVDAIFDGANDLVVDTPSMVDLSDTLDITQIHDFGTNAKVHHTNYFDQRVTYDKFAEWLW